MNLVGCGANFLVVWMLVVFFLALRGNTTTAIYDSQTFANGLTVSPNASQTVIFRNCDVSGQLRFLMTYENGASVLVENSKIFELLFGTIARLRVPPLQQKTTIVVQNCSTNSIVFDAVHLSATVVTLVGNHLTSAYHFSPRIHMKETELSNATLNISHNFMVLPVSQIDRRVAAISFDYTTGGCNLSIAHNSIVPYLGNPIVPGTSQRQIVLHSDGINIASSCNFGNRASIVIITNNVTVMSPEGNVLLIGGSLRDADLIIVFPDNGRIPMGSILISPQIKVKLRSFDINSLLILENATFFGIKLSWTSKGNEKYGTEDFPKNISILRSAVAGPLEISGIEFRPRFGVAVVDCTAAFVSLLKIQVSVGGFITVLSNVFRGLGKVQAQVNLQVIDARKSDVSLQHNRICLPLFQQTTDPKLTTRLSHFENHGVLLGGDFYESVVNVSHNTIEPCHGVESTMNASHSYFHFVGDAIRISSVSLFHNLTALNVQHNNITVRSAQEAHVNALAPRFSLGAGMRISLVDSVVKLGSFHVTTGGPTRFPPFFFLEPLNLEFKNASFVVIDLREGSTKQNWIVVFSAALVIRKSFISGGLVIAGFSFAAGSGLILHKIDAENVDVQLLTLSNASILIDSLTLDRTNHYRGTRLELKELSLSHSQVIVSRSKIRLPVSEIYDTRANSYYGVLFAACLVVNTSVCVQDNSFRPFMGTPTAPGPLTWDLKYTDAIVFNYDTVFQKSMLRIVENDISVRAPSEKLFAIYSIFDAAALVVGLQNSTIPVGCFDVNLSDTSSLSHFAFLNSHCMEVQDAVNCRLQMHRYNQYERNYNRRNLPQPPTHPGITFQNSFISESLIITGLNFTAQTGLTVRSSSIASIYLVAIQVRANATILLENISMDVNEHFRPVERKGGLPVLSLDRLFFQSISLMNRSGLIIRNILMALPFAELVEYSSSETGGFDRKGLRVTKSEIFDDCYISITECTLRPATMMIPRPDILPTNKWLLWDADAIVFDDFTRFFQRSSLTISNNSIQVRLSTEHLLKIESFFDWANLVFLLTDPVVSIGSLDFRVKPGAHLSSVALNPYLSFLNASNVYLSTTTIPQSSSLVSGSFQFVDSFVVGPVLLHGLGFGTSQNFSIQNCTAHSVTVTRVGMNAGTLLLQGLSLRSPIFYRGDRIRVSDGDFSSDSHIVIRTNDVAIPLSETYFTGGQTHFDVRWGIIVDNLCENSTITIEENVVNHDLTSLTRPTTLIGRDWQQLSMNGIGVNGSFYPRVATKMMVTVSNNEVECRNESSCRAISFEYAFTKKRGAGKGAYSVLVANNNASGQVEVPRFHVETVALVGNNFTRKVQGKSTIESGPSVVSYALCNRVGGVMTQTSGELFEEPEVIDIIKTRACSTADPCVTVLTGSELNSDCLPTTKPTLRGDFFPLTSTQNGSLVLSVVENSNNITWGNNESNVETCVLLDILRQYVPQHDDPPSSATITLDPQPITQQTTAPILVNRSLSQRPSTRAVSTSLSYSLFSQRMSNTEEFSKTNSLQIGARTTRVNPLTISVSRNPVNVTIKMSATMEQMNMSEQTDPAENSTATSEDSKNSYLFMSPEEYAASSPVFRTVALATASSAVVVAAITGGGAPDLQALALLGGMPCMRASSRGVGKSTSRVVSPLQLHILRAGDDTLASLVGSVVIGLAISGLHFLVVVCFKAKKKISFVEASSACRFPSLSVRVFLLLFQGLSYCSVALVIHSDSALLQALGVISLLAVFVPLPCLSWKVWKKSIWPTVFYKRHENVDNIPLLKKLTCGGLEAVHKAVFPEGDWTEESLSDTTAATAAEGGEAPPAKKSDSDACSTHLVSRYGAVFRYARGSSFLWLQPVLLTRAILVDVLALLPPGLLNCSVTLGVLTSAHIILALVVFFLRPYRIGISNGGSFALNSFTAVVLLCNVASSPNANNVAVLAQLLASIFSFMFTVLLLVIGHLEKKWAKLGTQKDKQKSPESDQENSGDGVIEMQEVNTLQVPLLQQQTVNPLKK